jgi:Fic family protein
MSYKPIFYGSTNMKWNWQQPNWPNFTYNSSSLAELEKQFAQNSAIIMAIQEYLDPEDKDYLKVIMTSEEALKTSEIEGEYLNRDSIQSSICKHFGLSNDNRRVSAAESGISEMMINLYKTFSESIDHDYLYKWHLMITHGRKDLKAIGKYRIDEEPMQVISGPIGTPKVHFEAPDSKDVFFQMEEFISWFNRTSPNGKAPLSPLIRAGITHLYFICIHPFEDGNGRVGRALVEKALAQSIGQPTLIALSKIIESNKKSYYSALEDNNKAMNITNWLEYFAKTILEAQNYTHKYIDFLIKKAKLYSIIKNQLNLRQEKVIKRIFQEGLEGFKGGLSTQNYISITDTSRATATRDLQDLISKKILFAKGELKSTRYYLNI